MECAESFSKILQYQMSTPFDIPGIVTPTYFGGNEEVNRHILLKFLLANSGTMDEKNVG